MKKGRYYALGVGLLGLLTVGLYRVFRKPEYQPMTTVRVQQLLDQALRPGTEHPIHYVSARIQQGSVRLHGAAGRVPETDQGVTDQHAFRIASISKTFTATLILQLAEEGKLALSDRLADYLTPVKFFDADNLHRVAGHNDGHRITIEHLLRHTSGLADYITDEAFLAEVMRNPRRQWSAEAIMQRFYELKLADKAVARPGEQPAYSDTNYLLLGVLVEQITGKPLHQNLTERIFEPLGMPNTYLEFYQPPRGNAPLMYPYYGNLSLRKVNTSFDWGGGGLVSTHEDLHRFIRGLLGGRLFRQTETLRQMLDFHPENDARFRFGAPASEYGMGIRRLRLAGYTLLGHSGSWGCLMLYDSAQDVSITVSVNQAQHDGLLGKLTEQLLVASKD